MKVTRLGRKYNALITETFDLAEKQYQEHLRNRREPFTLVVKDNFAVENVKMTCASKMLSNFIAPYTATVVQRLLQKGGCLVGKANLDEFAMGSTNVDSFYGPVKNPSSTSFIKDDDFYVAGGSSGGCAVAVAEEIARVAIGSDTGGSTRNPASFVGVVGFKPSYGLVSRAGLVPLANSFDSPSFFTRNVRDCLKFFEMTLGRDPLDCTSLDAPPPQKGDNYNSGDIDKLRIAIPTEFLEAKISKDCEEKWKKAIAMLKELGAYVEAVSLPYTRYSIDCYHILNESDVFSNMARYDSVRFGHREEIDNSYEHQLMNSRTQAFNEVVRRRIFAGNYFNLEENKGRYFIQAAKIRRLMQKDFEKVFKEFDAILVPSTSRSAPKISEIRARTVEESRSDDFFTQSANMCGLPAVSVPFGYSSAEMPLGMQFICGYLQDRKCLALGKILHKLAEPNIYNPKLEQD
ncbi:Glutamyl-tRNA(Gln) amidotransferase subunit A, mitochondrial [Aphelenchoides bicaudatus]|nr:Glutamyl-tRNA(Gln) amidotransferase subunit A, mitochondrial [Aphelenchoides bicaudatus]